MSLLPQSGAYKSSLVGAGPPDTVTLNTDFEKFTLVDISMSGSRFDHITGNELRSVRVTMLMKDTARTEIKITLEWIIDRYKDIAQEMAQVKGRCIHYLLEHKYINEGDAFLEEI